MKEWKESLNKELFKVQEEICNYRERPLTAQQGLNVRWKRCGSVLGAALKCYERL